MYPLTVAAVVSAVSLSARQWKVRISSVEVKSAILAVSAALSVVYAFAQSAPDPVPDASGST